jgi:hypothetical protein
MMEHDSGQEAPQETRSVVDEALELIDGHGGPAVQAALLRTGDALVQTGAIERADDVYYLDYEEVREALRDRRDRRQLVAERARDLGAPTGGPPVATFGPAIPPNAPRMHLIREVLEIIG